MATRGDIVARTYKLLGESSNVQGFDKDNDVLPKMEGVIHRVVNGQVTDLAVAQQGGSKVYRSGYLPFLDSSMYFDLVSPQSLTADVATTDTTISFDSSDFADSGAVYTGFDAITYTGNNDNQITGCSDIDISHKKSEKVYQLYKIPSAIVKPFRLYHIVNDQKHEVTYADHRNAKNPSRYYEILQHNDDQYIHIVGFRSGRFMLYYTRKPVTMTNDADECIIPDPYAVDLVANLVAGELLFDYEEYDDGLSKLNNGYKNLSDMYAFYAKQTDSGQKRIRVANNIGFHNITGSGKNR